MKLASWVRDGQPQYGLVDSTGLLATTDEFRSRYPELKDALAAGVLDELARDGSRSEALAAESVTLLPPVPRPEKILCTGMNYMAHIREMGREPPHHPALFARFPDSLVGHGSPLIRPKVSDKYDFEGELAVVIGRRARHVRRRDAFDFVAGYTCLMEGTLRDYQDHTSQFTAGKNFQHSGAMGPWLVTTHDIPDPAALTLQTRVNREVMQQGDVADLCQDIPALIAYISSICELKPGDVIATGTPGGVGAARHPPRWLKPGDLVEVEITGIGVLANTVADEAG